MALIFDSDAYSRKSHRSSGRRRTATSYDKYGYQVANYGSSSFSTESGMHVLRVKPGVIVNFIEPPSSSSRHRSRTHHTSDHKSSRKGSHTPLSDDERDPGWAMTYSPHPRAMELFDDGGAPQPFSMDEASMPPRDPQRRSPPSHHSSVEMRYPHDHRPGPEMHYPAEHRPSPEMHYQPEHRPSPEMHYQPEHRPSPEMHYQPEHRPSPEMHYQIEHHPNPEMHYEPEHRHSPEMHYPAERHSPRHLPAPIDIPIHSRSSDSSLQLTSTASSLSSSGPANYGHETQSHYFAPRHTPAPIEIPGQISSPGRHLSRSFEYPSPRMSSSSNNSPTSGSRTVRFNENPVLPSPGALTRRKGWWNKRGDQLWDNDGSYRAALEHEKYPLDLQNYPEPGTGWMNEDGVHIDTKRRLVQKKALKSALKKTSSSL